MTKKQPQAKLNPLSDLLASKDNPHCGELNADQLMEDLIAFIKNYVVLSDHSAMASALWIVHTWCYQCFDRTPLLLINAPERECGKTQLLKLVKLFAYSPLETANITTASLFRIIGEYQPTLLIDEADTFMKGREEMSGIINHGYDKGGYVLRLEPDPKTGAHQCRMFPVFAPKALAGIALERHLQPATMSRGIQVLMRRKTKDDVVQRLRHVDPEAVTHIRSRILRFVRDNIAVLTSTKMELPEQLGDRQQDCWEPLLTIAYIFGAAWRDKAVEAALKICAETDPPKTSSNQLLEDIREVLQGHQGLHIASAQLLELLCGHPDMDWCRYNHGQALTARQLAKFLASYEIKPKTVRLGASHTPKGYEIRQFQQAFDRYLEELCTEQEKVDAPIASQFAPVFSAKEEHKAESIGSDEGKKPGPEQGAGSLAEPEQMPKPVQVGRLPIPRF